MTPGSPANFSADLSPDLRGWWAQTSTEAVKTCCRKMFRQLALACGRRGLAVGTGAAKAFQPACVLANRPFSTIPEPSASASSSSPVDADMDAVAAVASFKHTAPTMLIPEIDGLGRAYGTGRRKTSSARVWVKQGSGRFTVNGKDLKDYFQPLQREEVLLPFLAIEQSGLYDVWCTVKGGGITGQAGAVRLGASRALTAFGPDIRPTLKKAGFITRDSRRVERKKPGQPKARKKFQWVKR